MAEKRRMQGTFSKHGEEWVARIPDAGWRTAAPGEQVTLHKANGALSRVTLTEEVDRIGGKVRSRSGRWIDGSITLFRFTEGWSSTQEDSSEDE